MRKLTRITVEPRTDEVGPLPRRIRREAVSARDLLPELAPPEALAAEPAAVPAPDNLRDLPMAEARPARLTVYALNAIVMIFAMPVGAALLVLNVLGGENLRATAHGLALTGAYMGLMSTPHGAVMLSALL